MTYGDEHYIAQLMHTNCKILRLLKIVKIIKAAPTCFGSHKNNHQGATFNA